MTSKSVVSIIMRIALVVPVAIGILTAAAPARPSDGNDPDGDDGDRDDDNEGRVVTIQKGTRTIHRLRVRGEHGDFLLFETIDRANVPLSSRLDVNVRGRPFVRVRTTGTPASGGSDVSFGKAFTGVLEESFRVSGGNVTGTINDKPLATLSDAKADVFAPLVFADGSLVPPGQVDLVAFERAGALIRRADSIIFDFIGPGLPPESQAACVLCTVLECDSVYANCLAGSPPCGPQCTTNADCSDPSAPVCDSMTHMCHALSPMQTPHCFPDPRTWCHRVWESCQTSCTGGCDTCCTGESFCISETKTCSNPPSPPTASPTAPVQGPDHEVRVDAAFPGTTPAGRLYMTASFFFYTSTNAGASWTRVPWTAYGRDVTSITCSNFTFVGGDTDVVVARSLGAQVTNVGRVPAVFAEHIFTNGAVPKGVRIVRPNDAGEIDNQPECQDLPIPQDTLVIDKPSLAISEGKDKALFVAWQDGGKILNATRTSKIWLQKIPLTATGHMQSALAASTIQNPGDAGTAVMHWGTCTPTPPGQSDDAGRGNLASSANGDIYIAFTSNTAPVETHQPSLRRTYVEKLVGANLFISCVDEFVSTDFAVQGEKDDGDPDLEIDELTGQMVVTYSRNVRGVHKVVVANSVIDAPDWAIQTVYSGGAADQTQPALALNKRNDPVSRQSGDFYVTWYEPAGLTAVRRAARGFSVIPGRRALQPLTPQFLLEQQAYSPFPFTCVQGSCDDRGVFEYQGVTYFPGRANGVGGWFAGWTATASSAPTRQDDYQIFKSDWP